MKQLFLSLSFLIYLVSFHSLSFGQGEPSIFENLRRTLEFKQDGTFCYKEKGCDILHLSIPGEEMISYGQWKRIGNKYVLYSDSTLFCSYSNSIEVRIEETSNKMQDSIYITIYSPFEQDKKNNPSVFQRAYLYVIDLYVGDSILSYFSFQNQFRIFSKNNSADKIKLTIIPYSQIYWRDSYYSKLQFEFIPTNGNNVFLLNAPNFTTFYPYYERIEEESVRIVNKRVVSFRGMHLKKIF